MTLVDELQPLLLCGALCLWGLFLYAWASSSSAPVSPCTVEYRLSQSSEKAKAKNDSFDSLMSERDPWVHHLAVSDRVNRTRPIYKKTLANPIVENALSNLSGAYDR